MPCNYLQNNENRGRRSFTKYKITSKDKKQRKKGPWEEFRGDQQHLCTGEISKTSLQSHWSNLEKMRVLTLLWGKAALWVPREESLSCWRAHVSCLPVGLVGCPLSHWIIFSSLMLPSWGERSPQLWVGGSISALGSCVASAVYPKQCVQGPTPGQSLTYGSEQGGFPSFCSRRRLNHTHQEKIILLEGGEWLICLELGHYCSDLEW